MRSTTALLLAMAVMLSLALDSEAQSCPNACSSHGQCVGTSCRCFPGWSGEDCSYQTTVLSNATTVSARLPARGWAYYTYQLESPGVMRWALQHETGGDCDLYINPNTFPTRSRWYMRDIGTDVSTNLAVPNAIAATWYAGVYGFTACNFQLSVYAYPGCPKNCSGHGICLDGTCQCDSGYGSADCSLSSAQDLISGQTIVGETIRRGEWKFYQTTDVTPSTLLRYTLNQTTTGDADIFVQVGHYPNFTNFLARDTSMNPVSHLDVRALIPTGTKATYYVGIFGFLPCTYNLHLNATGGANVCRDTTNCSLHGVCTPGGGCACFGDYNGTNCEFKRTPLSINHPTIGYVADNAWNYYVVRTSVGSQRDLSLHLAHVNTSTQSGTGDCDLYVRANAYPTRTNYDYADITAEQEYTLTIPNPVTEQVYWYIGIFGWSACAYVFTALPDNATRNCGPHGIDAGNGRCTCLDYYAGETCSIPTQALSNGKAMNGSLQFNQWAFFHISPSSGEAQALEVHLQELSDLGDYGNLWLYISGIGWPTLRMYDQADTHSNQQLHTVYDNTFDSDAFIGVYVSPYADPLQTYNFTIVAWYPDFK